MSRAAIAFACLFLASCRDDAHVMLERARRSATLALGRASITTRQGGMDVTFAVVSDTHLGYGDIEVDNARLVENVNVLAGRPAPPALGSRVDHLRGLVVTGDLTDWGREAEWSRFVAIYGLTGSEGQLRVPVFEMVGNHDKVENGPFVADQVRARHGGRSYAWQWGDLHCVALGEAPDDEALAFLARDLGGVAPDVPIVLFFHRALAGPWSADPTFDDARKEKLWLAIQSRNVVAIFHGHHHATAHYRWRGIDVWKPGAVKNGAHTLAVVRATDATFTVATYEWEHGTWASVFTKRL